MADRDIERLLNALDDPSIEYAFQAVDVAREYDPAVVVAAIEQTQGSRQHCLCDIAGYLRLNEAVPVLSELLFGQDERVQEAAAESLWKIADPAAADAVHRALELRLSDNRLARRHNLIIAVAATRCEAARALVEAQLTEPDEMLVRLANETLRVLDADE